MANFGEKMAKPGVIEAAQVIVEAFKELESGTPGNLMQGYMDDFSKAIAAKDPAALTYLAKELESAVETTALRYGFDFMRVRKS